MMQLLATPIYLSYWSATEFGAWLALQACIGVWRIPGIAHQDYVGNELMKAYPNDETRFSTVTRSALAFGFFYGLVETAIGVVVTLAIPQVLRTFTGGEGATQSLSTAFLILLVGQGLLWNWGGIWTRASIARGNYVVSAWLGVVEAVLSPLGPLLVLPFGAGITGAAAAMMAVTVPTHIFSIYLLRVYVVRELRAGQGVNWGLAAGIFRRAQALTLISVMAQLRQQGIRLVLAPLSGAASVAAFSTTRTGANLALQGLATITSPLMPDLMRFLNLRDQARSEAAFGTVWIVLVALMAPAVVFLQCIAPPLFSIWTRGRIPFDPVLFGVFSASVLIFAVAQPAMAVVTGNNLLRPQLIISLIMAVVVVGGMLVLVSELGILGAGIALLVAEVIAAVGYWFAARRWLASCGMGWPNKSFAIAATSVGLAGLAMTFIIKFPNTKWPIAALSFGCLGWNAWRYWHTLPAIAISKARTLLMSFLGVKWLAGS